MGKYILFGVALFFAALFVLSTLVGFVFNMKDVMQGVDADASIILCSYAFTAIGLVGWIASSFWLVLLDELDGVNPDDELSVTE